VNRGSAWAWALLVLSLSASVSALALAESLGELGLEPIPRGELASLEPAVRRQLEEDGSALAAMLEDPAATRERVGEAFGRLGQLYYGYAKRLPAAACYRNAVVLTPDDSRWHYYLGVIYQDEGRIEEALEELTTANRLQPYVPALIRLGDLELGRNRRESARPHYVLALEAHPSSAAAHYGLGRVDVAEGELASAVGHFQRALELQPQADRIHYLLGQTYRRLGDMAGARRHLEQSGSTRVGVYDPLMVELQQRSVGAGAALDRGAEARVQGLYDVALREYRAAVAADPRSAVARRSMGSILAITGAEAEAIAEFRISLDLEPDRPDALFALGHLLARHGKTEEARSYLERAADLDPRLAEARLALGALLAAAGEWERAATRYREILTVDPTSAEARLELGKVLVQAGRVDEGVAEFDSVAAADVELERRAQAHYYRAIADLRGGAEDAGMDHLRQALDLDPTLTEASQMLGSLLIRRGRFAEAVAELDRLLEHQPANANARLAQMTALVFAGDIAAARRRLEDALAVLPESPEIKFNLARLLACGPDKDERDGGRAVALAEELQRSTPNLQNAETLAMALAEAERFDEAVGLQQRITEQAAGLGNQALVGRLQHNLDRYRRGESCDPGALSSSR
jgi:tetratricopeptide (TPR) repeat protein